uniref:EGF-like domain-containing protein n=1 Tax=Branchiostoma floridae TaxID=7739 RepID=C3Z235_BRAFL|eukprot:XP_002597540.1 hypothetical protein BRAFLDRAFT_78909 [Branchiostoma floridae]
MTSYTMTGDTHEGRPVYYSNATCDFLYYKCGDHLQWCVGRQIGGAFRGVFAIDSHLYADKINGTFFLWDGEQFRENSDVKIACSDDAPAGAVVPQPVSNTTDCTRVRLQGDDTYQSSRMTTYTMTDLTSGGRPVYVSDTDSRDFLFFFRDQNRWWVGRTIGQAHGGAYVYDCAMTPDQTRPVWYLYDGSQWHFVPSVHATCVALPPLMPSFYGFDIYKVLVTGSMLSANLRTACESQGMQTVCYQANEESNAGYWHSYCQTIPVGTGVSSAEKSQQVLAHHLCGTLDPKPCEQLYDTFVAIRGWRTNDGACGVSSSSWCLEGNSLSNKYALCAKAVQTTTPPPTTLPSTTSTAVTSTVLSSTAGVAVASTTALPPLMPSFYGFDIYKVPVSGSMLSANLRTACESQGMQTVCYQANEESNAGYWLSYCQTIPVGTGVSSAQKSQQILAHHLCGTLDPKPCEQLYDTFVAIRGWRTNDGACGVSSSSWCLEGNSLSNKYALCAKALQTTTPPLTTPAGTTSTAATSTVLASTAGAVIATTTEAKAVWQQVEGGLKFVSVGQSGVWGVNSNDRILYRTGTYDNEASPGSGWVYIDGRLKQISSGNNIVWGVNSNDDIYMRSGISSSLPQGINWSHITGKLKQVHVSSTSNQVWGVDSGDNIFRRTGVTTSNPAGANWEQIIEARSLKFVSVGQAGVWGVSSNDQIYYRTGTFGNETSPGNAWLLVSGSLNQISSGNGEVWGVDINNRVFVRRGISAGTPQGTNWELIEGSMNFKEVYISSSSNQVWGVDTADNVYQLQAVQTTTPPPTTPASTIPTEFTSTVLSSTAGAAVASTTDNVGPCASSPCANLGTCVEVTAGFQCQCTLDYVGTRCEANSQISASSHKTGYEAWRGRLSGSRAWEPASANTNQWLQVSFTTKTIITGIQTQGLWGYHVKSYMLLYGDTEDGLSTFQESGANSDKIFNANSDGTTVVRHDLNQPIITSILRVNPRTYQGLRLRMELLGCEAIQYTTPPPTTPSASTTAGADVPTTSATITSSPNTTAAASSAINLSTTGGAVATSTPSSSPAPNATAASSDAETITSAPSTLTTDTKTGANATVGRSTAGAAVTSTTPRNSTAEDSSTVLLSTSASGTAATTLSGPTTNDTVQVNNTVKSAITETATTTGSAPTMPETNATADASTTAGAAVPTTPGGIL